MSVPPIPLDLSTLPPEARVAAASLLAQNAVPTEQVGALTERTGELSEYVKRLEHLVEEFKRALYGKGSEQLTEEQRQFACEEIEVAIAEVENTGEEPETGG